VFENIRVAAQARLRRESNRFLKSYRNLEVPIRKTEEILHEIGLAEQSSKKAHELSYGDQRALEIGVCLASDPIFLLLDEPTCGMSADETPKMMGMIKGLCKKSTVLLIEHDIEVVMSVSDKITVLSEGSKIAEGNPDEIKGNEEVRRIYLGNGTS
jgi:branched-chain amino acid transport system ATP-binding protein